MAKAKKATPKVSTSKLPQSQTAAYLAPILEAAKLLNVRVYPPVVSQLTMVLQKLGKNFPGDVLKPVDALAILGSGMTGSVEELEILDKVWPDWSGDKRFTLTPTTLTWRWSSKKTGRYATITVPFPTVLPMQVTVGRYCDMDEPENHCDECQVEEWDNCNCESFVEQEVSATVTDWNEQTAAALASWLARAVDEPVEPVTLPAASLTSHMIVS